jgi:hypothetical protein
MTDAEKLAAVRSALGLNTALDAHDNLVGAITDMEHANWAVDPDSRFTLDRVLKQLRTASEILRKRD